MLYTPEQMEGHTAEILSLLYRLALHDSRIPVVLPGSEMTEEAALAVRAFQQAYGLPVTGEIDEATWCAIAEAEQAQSAEALSLHVFPAGAFCLVQGDSGSLTELVQLLLHIAARRYSNLEPPPVTGRYDEATAAAVARLQGIGALPVTGTLDRKSWNILAALVNDMSFSG